MCPKPNSSFLPQEMAAPFTRAPATILKTTPASLSLIHEASAHQSPLPSRSLQNPPAPPPHLGSRLRPAACDLRNARVTSAVPSLTPRVRTTGRRHLTPGRSGCHQNPESTCWQERGESGTPCSVTQRLKAGTGTGVGTPTPTAAHVTAAKGGKDPHVRGRVGDKRDVVLLDRGISVSLKKGGSSDTCFNVDAP